VASAVNGAIREIGTAFSIALLGTIMNQVYQRRFHDSSAMSALRDNPANAALQPLFDLVRSGAGFAGHVVEDPAIFPGFTSEIAATVRDVSAEAFMAGMDRAIIIGALTMLVAAVVSFFLIDDDVVSATTSLTEVEAGTGELAMQPVPVSADE
jgi:hypothetical protein